MSRADAIVALRAESAGFASGVTWLSGELLDEVAAQTGAANRAQALAAFATSVPVDLAFVDAAVSEATEMVATLHVSDVAAVWAVDGVFSRVARAVGWSQALRMTVAEPAELAARLGPALHEALAEVQLACVCGADAVLIGDDLAGPAGPLLAPDYALDALVPCYRRLALEVTTGGLPALFHSDGDIRVLLPALARAGFSAVHLAGLGADSFAASARAARGAGLVVLGGIPAAELVREHRNAVEHATSAAGSPDGMIVCDDGGITTFEQLTMLGAAIDAAREAFRHPHA